MASLKEIFMSSLSRIGAVDILKGLIIITIVFLNILFLDYQPLLINSPGTPVPVGYAAGILFPAIIFLLGVTIPFSIAKRINEGLSGYDILKYIFGRSIILIAVGVLMVNGSRVEPALTGIGKNLWTILLSFAIFLTWNRYPEKENNFFTTSGLRFAGLAILVFLVFRFRSGSFENNGSLIPGWWELPGLAGWGFLISGLTYLAFRNSIAGSLLVWSLFLALNILSWMNMTSFLEPLKPYFGVLLNGYIPFIILSGHLAGILLKKYPLNELRRPQLFILAGGLVLSASGILLLKYSFPSGILGNPAWALISSGVTAVILTLLLMFDEGLKSQNPLMVIKPLGVSVFTVYIVQFFLFSLAGLTGNGIFFFLKKGEIFLNLAGSAVWTLIIIAISSLLLRFNIRLKF